MVASYEIKPRKVIIHWRIWLKCREGKFGRLPGAWWQRARKVCQINCEICSVHTDGQETSDYFWEGIIHTNCVMVSGRSQKSPIHLQCLFMRRSLVFQREAILSTYSPETAPIWCPASLYLNVINCYLIY